MARLMGFNLCLTCLVLSMGGAVGTSVAADSPNRAFRVCFEMQNNMPFIHGVPEDGVVVLGEHGVLADLLILTAEELAIELNFSFMPWKRCIQQLSQGKVDGIIAAIWASERDSWGVFPKAGEAVDNEMAIWFVDYLIYTKSGSVLTWDGKSFSGVRHGIAAPLGYIAHQKLSAMGVLHEQSLSLTDGFALLALERLDGYVVEETIGRRVVMDLQLSDKLESLTRPFMRVHWFMPVSHQWYKAYPEFSLSFWSTLSEIRKTQGERLLQHYLEQYSDLNTRLKSASTPELKR
ncbi:substrate-binding periplasmic protein [Shewanella atlantica]|uniref:substrate-binding periplasmic protein n=1 Tax=Shewanella atlantica TaxID=271099 RepID=UPI0037361FC8